MYVVHDNKLEIIKACALCDANIHAENRLVYILMVEYYQHNGYITKDIVLSGELGVKVSGHRYTMLMEQMRKYGYIEPLQIPSSSLPEKYRKGGSSVMSYKFRIPKKYPALFIERYGNPKKIRHGVTPEDFKIIKMTTMPMRTYLDYPSDVSEVRCEPSTKTEESTPGAGVMHEENARLYENQRPQEQPSTKIEESGAGAGVSQNPGGSPIFEEGKHNSFISAGQNGCLPSSIFGDPRADAAHINQQQQQPTMPLINPYGVNSRDYNHSCGSSNGIGVVDANGKADELKKQVMEGNEYQAKLDESKIRDVFDAICAYCDDLSHIEDQYAICRPKIDAAFSPYEPELPKLLPKLRKYGEKHARKSRPSYWVKDNLWEFMNPNGSALSEGIKRRYAEFIEDIVELNPDVTPEELASLIAGFMEDESLPMDYALSLPHAYRNEDVISRAYDAGMAARGIKQPTPEQIEEAMRSFEVSGAATR